MAIASGGFATPERGPVVAPIEVPFRVLPGQYFDAETGNHYNYFRDYDPRIGRYVESDPIGLGGGNNVYSYVSQNPLADSDPLGLVEHFKYDNDTQILTCECGGKPKYFEAFSGLGIGANEAAPGGPIPKGQYYITNPYKARPSLGSLGPTFYRLYRDDGRPNDSTLICDSHAKDWRYRDAFRFHPGSRSLGCVTVSSSLAWRVSIQPLLEQTKPELIPGSSTPYYGILRVQ